MDLSSFLPTVLHPSFHLKSQQWLRHATPRDIKGLKLLAAIYKHKGLKKFRNRLNVTTTESFFTDVSREIEKRSMLSTYDSDFSTCDAPQRPKTTLMTSSRFMELPCSRVLSTEAATYLRSWISLRDAGPYLDIILDTLRSILAFCNYPGKMMTEAKEQYRWTRPKEMVRCKSLVCKNRPILGPSKQLIKRRPPIDIRATSVCHLFTLEQVRQRREALMKGSGQVATWLIGAPDTMTSYQSTYGTPFNKYPIPVAPDCRTSVALVRMVPNPDTLPRLAD